MNVADKILKYKALGFEFLIRKVDNYLCVTAYKDNFTTSFSSITTDDDSLEQALANVFLSINSYLKAEEKKNG